MHIKMSNDELFANLQTCLVDIVLIEMIKDKDLSKEFNHRLIYEKKISEIIKSEMRKRFPDTQLRDYLINNHSCRVDLRKIIGG